jgi:gliding motility-associated-like protein
MIDQYSQRSSGGLALFRVLKSQLKTLSILAFIFSSISQPILAQCDVNRKYDKIVSGYHASIALSDNGSYYAWGQAIAANGTADVAPPVIINSTNYSGLTGTVLFTSVGGPGSGGQDQYIALTTTGLHAWGTVGSSTAGVLSPSLKSTSAIGLIATPTGGDASTKLPTGVTPAQVTMMIAMYQTLAIVANGNVWVLSNADANMQGDGSSLAATTWHKVKISAGVDLTNVTAIRGQLSASTQSAMMALTSTGSVYTWGATTYLGNNTAPTAKNYATLMTLPAEFTSSNIPKMLGVTGGTNGSEIANTLYLLSTSGSLYALGDNNTRQCGDFTTTERRSWVNVKRNVTTNFDNVNFISVQEHTGKMASAALITTSGDLYTWGDNNGNMIGRASATTTYDPGFPQGFASGTDKAIFTEMGGHTLVYVKEGSSTFCYVGHRTNGSMGESTSSSGTVTAFDCTNTPTINLCGAVPVVADPTKSTISASPTTITANGTSTSTITIQLKDASGVNLTTTGGSVIVTTTAGTLGTVVDNNNGTYTVILTSSASAATATIGFSINGTTATGSNSTATVNFVAGPSISTSGSLSTFTACSGSISTEQSFRVSGSALTNDITIGPLSGYEFSLTSGGSFSSSLTLTQSGGNVSLTTVYVRLAVTAANGAGGNIAIASTGATTQNVASGTAVVNAVPSVVTTAGGSNVGTGTVALSATATSGAVLDWYAASSGGSSLSTGLSYTTPSISTTTTYYVEARNTTTGCISSTRTAVVATISSPGSPSISTGGSFGSAFSTCLGIASSNQTFTVSGTLLTANLVITAPSGYEVSLNGTGYLGSVSISPSSGTVSTTTIYVRLTSSASNGASGNIVVSTTGAADVNIPTGTGVVNALPTVTGTSGGSNVGTGTVSLAGTASAGATLDWFAASSGGSSLASGLSFTTPSISSTTTYYVEARNTITGCISSSRTAVVATITSAFVDSDGDGVSDAQELLDGTNPNDGCSYFAANQIIANTSVSWQNADCDGDGNPNRTDSAPLNFCVDGSGIAPVFGTPAYDVFREEDCDGDDISNGLECHNGGNNCEDFDHDGIPDYLDQDSDNDGILDRSEKRVDSDGDGHFDYIDIDSDNDGILDRGETGTDFDGDGQANFLDLDSDGDGILDSFEGLTKYRNPVDGNSNGRVDCTNDANGNGLVDCVESAMGGASVEVPDTDGDGKADFLDLDSDNDGILDRIELGSDLDGDSLPNYRDLDSDGDKLSDQHEGINDLDGDGAPNFLDLDSDGDGILDRIEGPTTCVTCTDRLDNNENGFDDRAEYATTGASVDTDKDGSPDFLDLDSDNDGIPDAVEAGINPINPVDTDKDGIADFRDVDSDNDGIPDSIEAGKDPAVPVDTDKDGTPDFRDLDSDNDGISDAIEAGADPKKPLDTDSDGVYDFRDLDSDNDGISDNIEKGPTATPVDTDKDGLPDYRDIDSDNDGISDNLEKGPTATPVDTDGDGTPDYRDLDSDNDGISDNIEKGPTASPVDTDGDGTADFRDLDSDNDGILDNIEKGPTATPVDTDGDGVYDFRDLDSDNDGISDNIEKGPTTIPVDTDGDGIPDYRDLDSDSDTISDNIEKGPTATPVDTDKDGAADFRDLDSDNDGISDKVEAGSDPKNPLDSDKDLTYDFRDFDSDNDGILDKDEENVNISGLTDCDHDGIPNRLDADQCPSFMPQGISPNGDGKNDTFIIPGILNAQPNTVTIYNRWGNIVYQKDNYLNDWHGQTDRAFDLLASDSLLPDGTYYYVVDYKGNKPNVKAFIYVNRLDK